MRSFWTRMNLSARAASFALGLCLLASPASFAQGGEPQYFAIRGAKIIPVSGPPIENATVVVARGVILAVGGKDVPIPADAWVIEGQGLTVYPGLVDSFTDVGIPPVPAPSGEAAGPRRPAETARGPEDRPNSTPWRSAADEVNLTDKRIETWRDAGFTTVICSPKPGFFPGQAAVLDLAGDRPGDLVVKAPVAIPVAVVSTASFGRGFPDSLMGVLAYEHQVFLDTEWLTKAEAIYEKSPKGVVRPHYDRTSAAIADALQDHAIVLLSGNSPLDILRALDLTERWKVNAAIYGGQAGYEVASEIAARKVPVLVNLKWPEAEKDSDPDETPSLRTLRFRDRAASTPAAFVKAGVKFAFYSGEISNPKDLVKAVKKSIDAGLAPDAAIRALTLTPAEIFGVADRLGSIEKGKIASLVVTDGDLFNENTKIKYVFVDGRRFTVREPEKPKDPPKGDLTGKWKLSFTTQEGPDEATAELAMASDGTLSGSVHSKHGDGNILSGYLSGEKFHFVINIAIEGSYSDVDFDGTFDGTAMKGNISVQGYSIDFTGVKPVAPSDRAALANLQEGAAR